MNHKEYIKISEDVAKKLNNHLKKFVDKNPAFKKISKEYTKKRVHLNGIQFYAGFIASNPKEDFTKFYNIPIAIECVMLMGYKANRILDYKQEVWNSEEKIKETVLERGLYLSLILELLEESKEALGDKYETVRGIILDLLKKINKAFWFEDAYLNIKNSSLKEVLKNWKLKYKKRNVLFCEVYDYAPLIGYYIGSGDKTIFDKYEKYFKDKDKISHSGQIINDLSDYSSVYDENVKSYKDTFADIRNGIITQPTFELINEEEIKKALEKPSIAKNVSWRKKVMRLLIKKGIVKKIEKITQKSYNQNINFWKNVMNVDSELLFYTYFFLKKNKYYYEFENLKKQVKLQKI